jgi:primosomal protein N' (replication factor Y)
MVPEINLTPQLEARFTGALWPAYGDGAVVSLHSGMTNPQRLKSWLAAHSGRRASCWARAWRCLPPCRSCADRGGRRARPQLQAAGRRPLLGARPGGVPGRLEGRQGHAGLGHAVAGELAPAAAQPLKVGGRYQRLAHAQPHWRQTPRPAAGAPGGHEPPAPRVFSTPAAASHQERVARGRAKHGVFEPARLRAGAALQDCGWKSECPHCSAFRCSTRLTAPCAATTAALPSGAARLPRMRQPRHRAHGPWHRTLKNIWPNCWPMCAAPTRCAEQCPEGEPVRVARIDADTTKLKGALQPTGPAVHAGEVDVLVGTQMIAKGHDFRRITLVAAVNPDGALFSSDFPRARAPVQPADAGRRPRRARRRLAPSRSEMWVQTFHPAAPAV